MLGVGLDEVQDLTSVVKPGLFHEDRGRFLFLQVVTHAPCTSHTTFIKKYNFKGMKYLEAAKQQDNK